MPRWPPLAAWPSVKIRQRGVCLASIARQMPAGALDASGHIVVARVMACERRLTRRGVNGEPKSSTPLCSHVNNGERSPSKRPRPPAPGLISKPHTGIDFRAGPGPRDGRATDGRVPDSAPDTCAPRTGVDFRWPAPAPPAPGLIPVARTRRPAAGGPGGPHRAARTGVDFRRSRTGVDADPQRA